MTRVAFFILESRMAAPANGVDANPNSATQAAAITPHATNRITATRGVYVGGAGNVVCTMAGDEAEVTFTAVPAGTLLPIRVIKVNTTSTATSMLALY